MAHDEVAGKHGHLNDLANVFAQWLRNCMESQSTAVPFARPPGSVGLIVLKLSGEEESDEDLENEPLDRDRGNHTQDGM